MTARTSRKARVPPRAPRPAARPEPAPAPPLSLLHPALLAAAIAIGACVVVTASYRLYDSDLWQHLLVGRTIWESRSVPNLQLWTWPTWGTYDVTPSWLFRALLWPFWDHGGIAGVFLWRWLTSLISFGILWAAARRMGARGFLPLVVCAGCALIFRQRSQARPETLVAVLLAAQLWIHETRRNGGPDRTAFLPLVAMLWANAHISYWMGLAIQAVYLGEAWWAARGRGQKTPLLRLALVLAGSTAASFLNPAGWHALWQPFEYWLYWRHEPIFKLISELEPVNWHANLRNGLPLLLALWPALLLRRWRRLGFDPAETLLLVMFVTLALSTQRFVGFLALVAVPFVARDLDEWTRARRWPAWSRPPWARAALAVATGVAIAIPEWLEPQLPLGMAYRYEWMPVGAADFMRDHGVRGRGFNHFYLGGYLLWRFYPEKDRLPFIDIHQAGTREDRRLVAMSSTQRPAWQELDRKYRFDWVLLNRYRLENDRSLDLLDTDPAFALAFFDDNAALYVRRTGRMQAIADSFGYRTLGAGVDFLAAMGARANRDSAYRDSVAVEWRRMVRESPWSATAHGMLANVALLSGDLAAGRRELEAALAIDPWLLYARERLGLVALAEGRPREALDHFRHEVRVPGREDRIDAGIASAKAGIRRLEERRRQVRAELGRNPANPALRDTLESIRARLSPAPH